MNPILKYMADNKLNWSQMAKECGVSRNWLHNLAAMNDEQMMNVRLKTVKILKEKVGIDLAKILL